MTSVAVKFFAKKFFKNSDSGGHDSEYQVFKKGKPTKKAERNNENAWLDPLPLTDYEILKRVKRRAHNLDSKFFAFGIYRGFGWSSVVGLLPIVGDIMEFLMALSLIHMSKEISNADQKDAVIMWGRMMTNALVDLAIGFVPGLGDIADMFYRCNTKNADLLEDLLIKRAQKKRKELRAAEQKLANRVADPNYSTAPPLPASGSIPGLPPRLDRFLSDRSDAMIAGLSPPQKVLAKQGIAQGRRWFQDRSGSENREGNAEKGEAGFPMPLQDMRKTERRARK